MHTKHGKTDAITIALLAIGVLIASRSTSAAQHDRPALPTSCSTGDVVVSAGSDRFECVSLRDLLGLSRCSSGDLVMSDGGRVRCGAPSNCSFGGVLTVDTFGHPSCVSADDLTRR